MFPIRIQLFLSIFFHHLGRQLFLIVFLTFLSYSLFPTHPLVPSTVAFLLGCTLHRHLLISGNQLIGYLIILWQIPDTDFKDPAAISFWQELLEVKPGYLKEFQEELENSLKENKS